MHGEKPDLLVLGKLQYGSSQERTSGQVEGSPRFLDDQPLHFVLSLNLGQLSQIHDRQRDGESRRDYLRWLPIDHRECCSQSFVAPNDFVETLFERGQVERVL